MGVKAADSRVAADFGDAAYPQFLDKCLAANAGIDCAALCHVGTGEHLVRGDKAAAALRDPAGILGLARVLFGNGPPGDEDRRAAGALLGACGQVDALSLSRQTILFQETESVLVRRTGPESTRAVLLSVSNTLKTVTALGLAERAAAADGSLPVAELIAGMPDVLTGARLDLAKGAAGDLARRPDEASKISVDASLASAIAALASARPGDIPETLAAAVDGGMGRITRCLVITPQVIACFSRVPMALDHVLYAVAPARVDPSRMLAVLAEAQNDVLRQVIGGVLDSGLETTIHPFPETEVEFLEIVRELRALDEDDLIGRLDMGGFANHGFGEGEDLQRCQECIYYLPHRKWCDIPELPVPVEPHWWCRLWKL